jgi:hypothetical protein
MVRNTEFKFAGKAKQRSLARLELQR